MPRHRRDEPDFGARLRHRHRHRGGAFGLLALVEGRGGRQHPAYKNRIPMEIVRIFEKHGFIWGGRWSHYDTMHFEYRPELLP